MGGILQQPPAAMIEISRRHSSRYASSEWHSVVQIEKRTVYYHDQRSGEPIKRASFPFIEISRGRFFCSSLRRYVRAEKNGPDFRLTRSRHPSASGRRIGSSAGDGLAALRDPKPKRGVFYDAGLYSAEV